MESYVYIVYFYTVNDEDYSLFKKFLMHLFFKVDLNIDYGIYSESIFFYIYSYIVFFVLFPYTNA